LSRAGGRARKGDERTADPKPEPSALAREVAATVPDTLSEFWADDFARRWRGRDRTTAFERTLLDRLLAKVDPARVFELGTGIGRLTPAFRARAREYVGVDLSLDLLTNARAHLGNDRPHLLVHANVVHLPFVAGAASAAGLIRIYNHLTRPGAALAELRRILAPGGQFVASASVRPSITTLELDLHDALARRAGVPFEGLTFRPEPVVERRAHRMVVFFPTRRELDEVLARSETSLLAEYGVGVNDLYLFRRVRFPVDDLMESGRRHPRSMLFPMRWFVGRWGAPDGRPLPPLSEIFACPRCHTPLGRVDLDSDWAIACATCRFPIEFRDSILRAVWSGGPGGGEGPAPGPAPTGSGGGASPSPGRSTAARGPTELI